MTKADAARILDPETSREALAFLAGRPHIIDTLKQEACRMGAAALRPVSRERVERATWITTNDNGCPMYACSACGARDAKGLYEYSNPRLFCYHCGLPMTDEAVDIVLRRLEALHETAE